MFHTRQFTKSIFILSVLCLCFLFLNSVLPQAKKYPTVKVIKDVSITKDTTLNAVLPDGFLVSGAIEDSVGVPMVEAGISVREQNYLMMNFTNTDEQGKYKISLPKGTYDFRFEPPQDIQQSESSYAGISRATSKYVHDVQISKAKKWNIKLDDGVFLEGLVLNDLGLPASGSVLYAEDLSDTIAYSAYVNSETGNFRIALPVGMYALNVIRAFQSSEEVFSPFTNKTLEPIDLKNDTWLDVNLPKGVLVKGKVRDKKGMKVTAAINFINEKDIDELNPWVRGCTVMSSDSLNGITYQAGLTKGKYTAQVIPLQYVGSESAYSKRATVKILKKNIMKNKNLNMTLSDGFLLSGTVKDQKGKNLELAAVIMTNIKTPLDIFNKTKFMAATLVIEGNYSYPLPGGSYDVYFIPPPPDFSLETSEWMSTSSRKDLDEWKCLYFINKLTTNFLKSLK